MSSKKPFEHIEEKIKQAAENSLPAFDEKAWQAMEAKLDKDNKKRRPLLWWFILPLALAGGWGIYSLNNGENKKAIAVITTHNTNTNSSSDNNDVPKENVSTENTATVNKPANEQANTIAETSTSNVNTKKSQDPVSDFSQPGASSGKKTLSGRSRISGNKKGRVRASITGAETTETDSTNEIVETNAPEKGTAIVIDNTTKKEKEIKVADPVEQTTTATTQKTETEEKQTEKTESKKEEKPVETKKKTNNQQNKRLYFIAAAGADDGNTKFLSFSNSSVTPKYGIGVGYQFNNRWSVQTGFYAANKKYVAGPDDYTIKAGSPMGAYPLEKINATCLVYEIPLLVRYNVISKPSVILYTTLGASSYIMQKENYDCFYRYYNNVYEHNWYYNGNRHLFSTAIFSIGIEKPLSSKFSLLAEPSVSLPLSGVGDGKMKIYSSSALLGIKYYPFKK